MRLTPEEQLQAARFVAEKLNHAAGATAVLVPLRGGSIMDIEGGDFWLPGDQRRCNNALRDLLKLKFSTGKFTHISMISPLPKPLTKR